MEGLKEFLGNIGEFFSKIFAAIGNFFGGLFGGKKDDGPSANAAAAGGAAQQSGQGQGRGQDASPDVIIIEAAPPPPPEPLVDDQTRAVISNALQRDQHSFGVADTFDYAGIQARQTQLENEYNSAAKVANQFSQIERSRAAGQSYEFIEKTYGIDRETIIDSMDPEKVETARNRMRAAQSALNEFRQSEGYGQFEQFREAQLGRSGQNPRDGSIGEDRRIFDQDDIGRLVVNMPQNAVVHIEQARDSVAMPGHETMYTITVQPKDMPGINDPRQQADFGADRIEIPGSLLENAQVVFNAPSIGENRIVFQNGRAPEGTTLVVESEGAKVKNRGADAYVNGNFQTDAADIMVTRAPRSQHFTAPPTQPRIETEADRVRGMFHDRMEGMRERSQAAFAAMREGRRDPSDVIRDRIDDIQDRQRDAANALGWNRNLPNLHHLNHGGPRRR